MEHYKSVVLKVCLRPPSISDASSGCTVGENGNGIAASEVLPDGSLVRIASIFMSGEVYQNLLLNLYLASL